MKNQFLDIPISPPDQAFGLIAEFEADPHPNKVSLIAGAYRDGNGDPWVLPCVKQAKARLTKDQTHEYLSIEGSPSFIKAAQDLTFGAEIASKLEGSLATLQTVSGTGANHMAALFLKRNMRPKRVFIPSPSWINHKSIWDLVGVPTLDYPYYAQGTKEVDIDAMIGFLESESSAGDVLILQACAHNPTGVDLSRGQWTQVVELVQRTKLFVVFDSAYQGFATGDVDEDAWAVRYFVQQLLLKGGSDHPGLFVAQSFSKNFGLYGERVGAVHLVAPPHISAQGARSQLIGLARAEYSNPPRFGASIVETVLNDEGLRGQWQQDLQTMSSRINEMRHKLAERLESAGTRGDWSHVESQIGMFSYTGLDRKTVARLKEEFHIYLLPSGRASICGLNDSNIEYVVQAIRHVVGTADS